MLSRSRSTKKGYDIPIAPVLDVLVVLVFFLILSVTFTQYTKHTLPASESKVVDSPEMIPLAPRVLIYPFGKDLRVRLEWVGSQPGHMERDVAIVNDGGSSVTQVVRSFAQGFLARYPQEVVFSLGLASNLQYQVLVSAMDGLQGQAQDVVLLAPSVVSEIAAKLQVNN
jgi:biopolymer transport protein ExbD